MKHLSRQYQYMIRTICNTIYNLPPPPSQTHTHTHYTLLPRRTFDLNRSFSYRIVIKLPSNEDYMWSVYTKQFEGEAWVALAFLLSCLVLCLLGVSRCLKHEVTISVSDSAFAVVGIIFSQGELILLLWFLVWCDSDLVRALLGEEKCEHLSGKKCVKFNFCEKNHEHYKKADHSCI